MSDVSNVCKLDEDGNAVARILPPYVRITHYVDGVGQPVMLLPKQALSLLAWLEQQRETLEQLAKEQEA